MVLLGAVAWVGVVLQAAGGGGWLPPAPVIAVGLQYSQRSTTNANCTWAGLEYFQGKFPRPSASRLVTVNFLVVFTKHRFLRRVTLNMPIARHG